MSDFEDDFVEVSGYHSNSDSDWERIDGYSSGFSSDAEEIASSNVNNKVDPSYHTVVHSYYRSPDNTHTQHLQEHKVPTHTSGSAPTTTTYQTSNTHGVSEEDEEGSNKVRKGRNSKKAKKLKEARRRQWTKLSLQSGHGAPYDPVEFLGITGADKALLSRFGITTIGQLAHLNAVDFISSMEPDKLGIILDLQERAYEAVTAFVTKAASQPEVVWGYLYLGDEAVSSILKKGYIDSDAHYFVWSPMPSVTYRDQRALDTIVGRETKNRDLCNRYSRYIKINLSKLCDKYYGRLYMRDPQDTRAKGKWQAISIMQAAELSQREDLWYPFEAGDEIFSRICHGSLVIPTGRIPKDCVELDKEECSFDDRMCPDIDSDHENLERPTAFDEIINNY